jgi:hypothetical protein
MALLLEPFGEVFPGHDSRAPVCVLVQLAVCLLLRECVALVLARRIMSITTISPLPSQVIILAFHHLEPALSLRSSPTVSSLSFASILLKSSSFRASNTSQLFPIMGNDNMEVWKLQSRQTREAQIKDGFTCKENADENGYGPKKHLGPIQVVMKLMLKQIITKMTLIIKQNLVTMMTVTKMMEPNGNMMEMMNKMMMPEMTP